MTRPALGVRQASGVMLVYLGCTTGAWAAETPPVDSGASFVIPFLDANAEDTTVEIKEPLLKSDSTLGNSMVIIPMVVSGIEVDSQARISVESGLRLGISQSGIYAVASPEETKRQMSVARGHARECFSEACVTQSARAFSVGSIIASQFSRKDSLVELKLVLLEAGTGVLRVALFAKKKMGQDSLIPFARIAGACLLSPDDCPNATFAYGRWSNIPWLNLRDSLDTRCRTAWTGSALLIAATGLAWAEGQLLQKDDNYTNLQRPLLDDAGGRSFLRGFFAAPTLGAQYAAMGGAGLAHVNNGLALLMNPAGVAEANRDQAIIAKRTLPGGVPSLFIALAGPLYDKWSQGLGVQYEGDALASETTVHGALAYDLAGISRRWEGMKVGMELKLYLAEVGRSGNGAERVTGHSFGAGLDLGLLAHLNNKITAALTIRDMASILRHSNTLTNQDRSEVLPPEYRLGAAYRASPSLLLLMDGQKSLYADQADHVRFGAEQVVFRFLALRCGMHQIFGRESVRKVSTGFGINSEAFGDPSLQGRMSLNYGYEFSLNEDQTLAGGQQFSLEMGF
jgi:hypothetical protein